MAVPSTHVVIVRHGHSVAQVEGFASGHDTCRGLSDLGRRQAEALRDRLLRTGELDRCAAVYTSVLPRAIETAAIIAPGLAGREAAQECDWCEIHAGEAEGLGWAEVVERFSADDPGDVFSGTIPGAETWDAFHDRVAGRLRRAATDHPGQTVVIVGHGGTVGAGFVAFEERPERVARALTHEARNTSITEWRLHADSWRLVRFNDASHTFGIT